MRLVARPVRFGLLTLALGAALTAAGAWAATLSGQAGVPADGEGFQGPESASPRSLRSIDVSPLAQGGDRVVLRLDGEPRYRLFMIDDPPRVVVDLEGTVNRLSRNVTPVSSASVERVRAAQWRTNPVPVARIVLDMNADAGVQAHADGTTLVVDVAGVAPSGSGTVLVAPPAPVTTNPAGMVNHMERAVVEAPEPTLPKTAAPAAPAKPTNATAATGAIPAAGKSGATTATTTMPATTAPPTKPAPATLPTATATTTASVSAGPSATSAATSASYTPPVEAAPGAAEAPAGSSLFFETRTIAGEAAHFTGKKISLNLVDADIRQVFRLFHEISGMNFVLDPSVAGRVTIVVDEVPWDQALDLILKNNGLDKVYENNVIRLASTQRLAAESSSRKVLKEAKELEADTVTITRTLSYAKAEAVDQIIKTGVLLSTRGKSFFDKRTNTIIITDVPAKIAPLDTLLTSLDERTTQVMIEARIVETSRAFIQDIGVKWGFHGQRTEATGNPLGWNFPHNATVDWDIDLSPIKDTDMLAFSFGNIGGTFTLNLALDALETEGRLRVLSAPKIATRNNEEAEIEQGVRIPIVNTTATEIAVEFVSASLRLKVTPQITAEGTVLMDIEVFNDTPNRTISTSTGTPGINTQRAKTHVIVSDGGTTVIGGIFVIRESQSEFGIPFFRKIPFFGWLFKSRHITNENQELLVFVTPKIMKW